MYGWLTLDENKQLVLNYPAWNFKAMAPPSEDERKARVERARPLITAAFPDQADLKLKIMAGIAVNAALAHVTEDQVDYAIHMGIAFYSLHRADPESVQKTIAAQVDGEFGKPAKDPDPSIGVLKERLKAVGFLLPAVSRTFIFNDFCSQLRLALLNNQKTAGLETLQQVMSALRPGIKQNLSPETQEAAVSVVSAALISCDAATLQPVAMSIHTLLTNKRSDVFLALHQHHTASPLSQPLKDWALRQGFQLTEKQPHRPVNEIAEDVFATAQAWDQTENGTLIRTSIAAIDAGVNIGAHTKDSREALQQVRVAMANRDQHQLQALITEARSQKVAQQPGQAHPTQSPIALQSGPDRDTLQTWSVDRLARWIDGPMAGPRRKALNHSKVVEQSKSALPHTVDDKDASRKPAPDMLTETDVTHIAADAYGATAGFFIGDIHDLLSLGKQLKANTKLLDACASASAALAPLAQAPLKVQEREAQDLLTRAEEAIEQLRDAVKAVQVQEALEQRFVTQLIAALSRETFTPGRRQGGVIACPLKFEDWAWVSGRFHQRWIPSAKQVTVNGEGVTLEVNEALALYVTGGSQSGYAFDVSVHLWRRDGDSKDLPSTESGSFPAMNMKSWFDTYTTCCVLHVPLAQ